MQVYEYPSDQEWKGLCTRPVFDTSKLEAKVQEILTQVQSKGDRAVLDYSSRFDGVDLLTNAVTAEEFEAAEKLVSEELKRAIAIASENIRRFHSIQLSDVEIVETMAGVKCWRKNVAIEKVGLYIPGGTAPLFSTILMLAIPAAIAGCSEVILTSPPSKDGTLHPAILYAAKSCGIQKVFKIGGVQAIAAMAFGTETIPAVSKIFGPGNQYVTCAKQLVQKYGVAIDMPAGPSEVAVFADDSANPAFVAADLLSQAEHGADSQVMFISTSPLLVEKVKDEISKQTTLLSRREIADNALKNSRILLFNKAEEATSFLNEYAPEHLILACDNADQLAEKVVNAGSVFVGHYSPESVGDYASGTNHTLPTNGYAKAYSGVSVDSFVKKITFQKLSANGLKNIGPSVEIMAEAEGLDAHKNAVSIRLQSLNEMNVGTTLSEL